MAQSALVFRRVDYSSLTYIATHRRSGTRLGTVSMLDDGNWHAISDDGKANFAFKLRLDGGLFLLRNASSHGCEPGCPCAEG